MACNSVLFICVAIEIDGRNDGSNSQNRPEIIKAHKYKWFDIFFLHSLLLTSFILCNYCFHFSGAFNSATLKIVYDVSEYIDDANGKNITDNSRCYFLVTAKYKAMSGPWDLNFGTHRLKYVEHLSNNQQKSFGMM